MERYNIVCPNCHVPIDVEGPIQHIIFPEDVKAIIDLLKMAINGRICPACRESFQIITPLVLVNHTSKILVVCSTSQSEIDEIHRVNSNGYQVKVVSDYKSARRECIPWIGLPESKIPEVATNTKLLDKYMQYGRPSKLQLSVLLAGIRKEISVSVLTNNSSDALEDYFTNSLFKIIFETFQVCLKKKQLSTLSEQLAKVIDVDFVTDRVLERLVEVLDNTPMIKLDEYFGRWTMEYLFEVLNQFAGKENPRKLLLTKMTLELWKVHRDNSEQFGGDDPFIIDKPIIESIITFANLFDVSVPDLQKWLKKSDKQSIEYVESMMIYLGWKTDFNKALQERIKLSWANKTLDDDIMELFWSDSVKALQPFANDHSYLDNAQIITYRLRIMLESSDLKSAYKFYELAATYALKNSNPIFMVAIAIESIKTFNEAKQFNISVRILSAIRLALNSTTTLPDVVHFNLLIEGGNTLRYNGNLQDSQRMYEEASVLLEKHEVYDDERRLEAELLVMRNLAIVYRDRGDYYRAVKMLTIVHEKLPDEASIVTNLANLYLRINQPKLAIEILKKISGKSIIKLNDEFQYDMALAHSYFKSEQLENYTRELSRLHNKIDRYNISEKAQYITITLLASDKQLKDHGFEYDLNDLAMSLLNDKDLSVTYKVSLACFLTLKFLRNKEIDKAKNVVDRSKITSFKSVSLEFNQALVWFYYSVGNFKESSSAMRQLLESLNTATPVLQNSEFAISWLSDKEEMQQLAIDIGFDLLEKGWITKVEFLEVVDNSFGKDISSKLVKEGRPPRMQEILDQISLKRPHATLFVYFQLNDNLAVISISNNTSDIHIQNLEINVRDIKSIKSQAFRAFELACPGLLDITDMQLDPLYSIFSVIGKNMLTQFDSNIKEVYIVTSEILSNLPLHLVKPIDSQTLIELMPVIYINSVSTLGLLTTEKNADKPELALISVTKSNETKAFASFLEESIDEIKKGLKNTGELTHLTQHEATVETVCDLLVKSDEIAFLCHGANGGENYGYGICLSASNNLPPPFFPIADVPTLKKNLLTWTDMIKLAKTPRLFVSLACSSGVTQIGKGGVQFGLEQTLFSKGTEAIISPLWNVEHKTAIYWLRKFYEIRANQPDLTLGEHYRLASLEVRSKYNHPFFWAPFIIKGISYE